MQTKIYILYCGHKLSIHSHVLVNCSHIKLFPRFS